MNTVKTTNKTFVAGALLLLVIIVSLVYSNHFHNSFHFDDSHTIVNNLAIRDLNNLPSFFKDGTTFSSLPSNQSYRPVVTTLNAIDYHLGGVPEPDPFMYHVSIFSSFLALGLLFFFVLKYFLDITLSSTLNVWVALFVTGWLWLHTANAETVNYIIARSDSFSTMLVVMAFAWYLYFPAQRKYHFYMIPVVLGFFTKEPAILFVPLLFLYKLFFEADLSIKSAFKFIGKSLNVLKQLIIPIVISIIAVLFYKSKTPSTWTPGGTDRLLYILTQPYVIFHYFKNFFVPAELVVDTDWQPVSTASHPWVFVGVLFLIVLIVIAYIASRDRKYRMITFGILWFLITLAPTSLIPFAEVLNDHRTFFPYIGLFIATACLVRNLLNKSNAFATSKVVKSGIAALAIIILSLNAYGTVLRNKIWHDEATLWKEATEKAPGNGRAWMNYGLSLMATGNYKEAEACFQKTLELWPNYAYIYINMGVLKAATGEAAAAEQYFKKALQLDPNNPGSYSFYIRFLIDRGSYSAARELVGKGLAISPSHPVLNEQAALLSKRATTVDNVTSQATAEHPTPQYYLNISLEHYNAGRFQACIDAAYKALSLKPDYDLAYNNICAAYNGLGEWRKAIEAGEKGLKINPNNNLLKGNLKVSYSNKTK